MLTPGYFKTPRIPLIEGLDFNDSDRANMALSLS